MGKADEEKNFVMVPDWFFAYMENSDKGLSSHAVATYLILLKDCDREPWGQCRTGSRRLARLGRCSQAKARASLRELVDHDLIRIEIGGPRRSPIYLVRNFWTSAPTVSADEAQSAPTADAEAGAKVEPSAPTVSAEVRADVHLHPYAGADVVPHLHPDDPPSAPISAPSAPALQVQTSITSKDQEKLREDCAHAQSDELFIELFEAFLKARPISGDKVKRVELKARFAWDELIRQGHDPHVVATAAKAYLKEATTYDDRNRVMFLNTFLGPDKETGKPKYEDWVPDDDEVEGAVAHADDLHPGDSGAASGEAVQGGGPLIVNQ